MYNATPLASKLFSVKGTHPGQSYYLEWKGHAQMIQLYICYARDEQYLSVQWQVVLFFTQKDNICSKTSNPSIPLVGKATCVVYYFLIFCNIFEFSTTQIATLIHAGFRTWELSIVVQPAMYICVNRSHRKYFRVVSWNGKGIFAWKLALDAACRVEKPCYPNMQGVVIPPNYVSGFLTLLHLMEGENYPCSRTYTFTHEDVTCAVLEQIIYLYTQLHMCFFEEKWM